MANVPFVPLLINGEHRPASTNATFDVYNSYSKSHVSIAAAASSEDCRLAIEAAHRAFPAWEATPLPTRRDILLRAAAIMDGKEWQDKAIAALVDEISASRPWAAYNVLPAASGVRNFAGMAQQLKGDIFPSMAPGGQVLVQKRAHGVMYVVSLTITRHPLTVKLSYSVAPWNAPVPLTIRACVLPLFCGNTVVLRPSEVSPRTQSLVIDALHEVQHAFLHQQG